LSSTQPEMMARTKPVMRAMALSLLTKSARPS
jgi:hypothetical protein